MHLFCARTGYDLVLKALLCKKIKLLNLNAKSNKGFTPLYYACSLLNLEAVKELLLRKADPMINCGKNKDSCLHVLAK